MTQNTENRSEHHVIIHRASDNKFKASLTDLASGITHWRLWTLLAWNDLHQRYKRTWLGMGWISLSFLLFALVKIFIFGPLTGKDLAFFGPFLAIGFLTFRLISNFISSGTTVFVGSANWIKSEPLPLSVYLYKLATKNLITFSFAAVPALLICFYFGQFHALFFAALPVALILFVINGIAVSLIMGVICSRYRDIMHFMTTVMQVLYFATPILWVPPETGPRALFAKLNPLTHYIAILREPALNNHFPLESLQAVGICTALLVIIAFICFAYVRRNIIYWI